ncbi:MAG TPA: hypothetical protein VFM32_01780 [Spongiibacteraceae bacterium]|nr:hypothetical protein [Spongiibacteraceae bacterium]
MKNKTNPTSQEKHHQCGIGYLDTAVFIEATIVIEATIFLKRLFLLSQLS